MDSPHEHRSQVRGKRDIEKHLSSQAGLRSRFSEVRMHLCADEKTVHQDQKLGGQRLGLFDAGSGEVPREGLANEVLVSHRDNREVVFLVGHFHRDVDECAPSVFLVLDQSSEGVERLKRALPAGIPDLFHFAFEFGTYTAVLVDQDRLDQALFEPKMPIESLWSGYALLRATD
ncbi:hypothetical protein HYG77_24260 [Rhodococcus sp. ZPP]|uniref:hypothetical protein n=1 Tax=Rhodococcus sp. ZPP TaxID=2749906 RepID=UPI001AD85FAA|nr:hypothetical protein [Rhodococcus sp. ZPP]QTJ68382.1 hypothetical protein HYG77_24260 [Rhodococcus sp. ZPP]